MNYKIDHTLFSDGNWSIVHIVDAFTGRNAPNALAHLCDKFENTNLHHIYHSIIHTIRCTECKEQVPESVETVWRLYNMNCLNDKTYVTIFLQSTKHLTSEEEEKVYINSKLLVKSNTNPDIPYTPMPRP